MLVPLSSVSKIIESSLSAIDSSSVYEDIISYVLDKHAVELFFITDPGLRFTAISDRAAAAVDEIGIVKLLARNFVNHDLIDSIENLHKEKCNLLRVNDKLVEILKSLSLHLINLQESTFGHVLFKVNFGPNIPAIQPRPLCDLISGFNGDCGSFVQFWRSILPKELLVGIRGYKGQSVFVCLSGGLWIKGVIDNVINRDEPLDLIDLNQQNNKGGKIDFPLERNCSDSQCDDGPRYLVVYQRVGQLLKEVFDPPKVALAISSKELTQKYPVGCRVVVHFEINGGSEYYSGLIGELPKADNNYRYLVFNEDAQACYVNPSCVFRIFGQSKENWQLIKPEARDFIKRYLTKYPQRAMAKLDVNQCLEVIREGKWASATVTELDGSLARLRFSDGSLEWIYRGSDRLRALCTAQASNNQARANGTFASADATQVKTRKSATGRGGYRRSRASIQTVPTAAASCTTSNNRSIVAAAAGSSGISNASVPTDQMTSTVATVLESVVIAAAGKLGDGSDVKPSLREAMHTGRVESYLNDLVTSIDQVNYVDHKCIAACLKKLKDPKNPAAGYQSENPLDYKGLNPLEIPLRVGWVRTWLGAQPDADGRGVIVYVAPCGRLIRSFSELDHYLHQTGSLLTSELFCFDKAIKINEEFRCNKTYINIADLSYKKENVPVPCVNCVDNESPSFVEYIPHRLPHGNVTINDDPDFLVCCDCIDGCRDRTKCACQQLTVEASAFASSVGVVNTSVGYHHRRLHEFTVGGIYECNTRCKCDRRCQNRVVQQGMWLRLQVFRTNFKGWGIRALNAIPKGSFICTYAGAIYDDHSAIREGCDNGDEYQAELDYIETIEREKEGFEPNAIEPVDSHAYAQSQQTAREEVDAAMSSFRSTNHSQKSLTKLPLSSLEIKVKVGKEKRSVAAKTAWESTAPNPNNDRPMRRRKRTHRLHLGKKLDQKHMDGVDVLIKPGLGDTKGVTNLEEIISAAAFDLKPVVRLTRLTPEQARQYGVSLKKWSKKCTRGSLAPNDRKLVTAAKQSLMKRSRSSLFASSTNLESGDSSEQRQSSSGKRRTPVIPGSFVGLKKSISNAEFAMPTFSKEGLSRSNSDAVLVNARRSRSRGVVDRRTKLWKQQLRQSKEEKNIDPRGSPSSSQSTVASTAIVPWVGRRTYPIGQRDWLSARTYFGEEMPFVMDAKKVGNLGRYFNHSCDPNVFVQNVFITSHDPRFPEVAFFAMRNIDAGEELTWDYGYVLNSVPQKALFCYCGEPSCRVRLL